MEIITLSNKNSLDVINKTIKILSAGGLVIFPSDTVYGLLVDASNLKAVNKLIDFKNRPPGKAISIFVSDIEMMKKYIILENSQEKTIREILPGPFTVILKSRHKVINLLESERGSLGIRIPDFQLILELVKRFGKPITATSANLASQSPFYSIKSLLTSLSERKKLMIDLVIDKGLLPRNKPSTVVDFTQAELKILRKGDLGLTKSNKFISKSPEETKLIASNFLNEHKYVKPLVFIIEGELGVGKTIFVKGLGESMGIKNIISPTFVIYYEYELNKSKIKNQKSKFIHLDLYNIQDINEFEHLHIEKLLVNKNILCFEWGEKSGQILKLLKSKADIVNVKMKYLSEKEREITIKN